MIEYPSCARGIFMSKFKAPLVLIAIISIAILLYLKQQSKDETSFAMPPTVVGIETVQSADLPLSYRTHATLRAWQSTDLSVAEAGIVKSFQVASGSVVNKGQLLLSLQNAVEKAALKAQQVVLKVAKQQQERQLKLKNKGLTSSEALEDADALVLRARATLELAEHRLAQKQLRAPFSGHLGLWLVEPGDYIQAGQALVHLINDRNLHVRYLIPEKHWQSLKLDQTVYLEIADQKISAKIDYIAPRVDQQTHTVLVQALLDNPNHRYKSGLNVMLEQPLGVHQQAKLISEESVFASIDGYKVYLVIDGIAHLRNVKLGAHYQGQVEILSGLKPGDSIVRYGHHKLYDGAAVQIK